MQTRCANDLKLLQFNKINEKIIIIMYISLTFYYQVELNLLINFTILIIIIVFILMKVD